MSVTTSSLSVAQVDVRGPRFSAWITTAVLVVVLALSTTSAVLAATILLALQTVAFAIGAVAGPRRSPYGMLFARVISPRLGPVTEREPVPPLRFAQLVGFVFAAVGVIGFVTGAVSVGIVATAFALFAAFLNAAFALCLGCKVYPLVTRFRSTPA